MKNITICIGLAKTGSSFLRDVVLPSCKNVTIVDSRVSLKNPIKKLIDYISLVQQEHGRDVAITDFDNVEINHLQKSINLFLMQLNYNDVVVSWPSFVGSYGGARDDFNSMEIVSDLLYKIFGKVKILLVIRRQDEYAKSLYSTYLKRGGHKPIGEFITYANSSISGCDLLLNVNYCNWNKIFDTYNKKFILYCIPYEVCISDSECYYKSIFSFFDILLPDFDQKKINSAYSPASKKWSSLLLRYKYKVGKWLLLKMGYETFSDCKRSDSFFIKSLLPLFEKIIKFNGRRAFEWCSDLFPFQKSHDSAENITIPLEIKKTNMMLDKKISKFKLKENGYY